MTTTSLSLEEVINNSSGLIHSIISKYTSFYEYDDLYQVATIGVIKAYYNYQNSFNTKFSTYAYTYIWGEVMRFINMNKGIKVSADYVVIAKKIREAKVILTQKLMKEPTTFQLAHFLELDEKLVTDVLNSNQKMDSLDRSVVSDEKEILLQDTIPSNDNASNINNLIITEAMETLDSFEKELIYLRFFEDKTQAETAKCLGINQVQVSRNLKRTLTKLRNHI